MTAGNDFDPGLAQTELFSALLTPHRSLNRTGFLVLMVFLSAVSFAAGLAFLLMGAWPVLGFFGLDALAIYCPCPRTFVYLLANELPANYVNLRLAKAKNGQVKRTRDAAEYRDPWRMFGPVAHSSERPLAKVGVGMPS